MAVFTGGTSSRSLRGRSRAQRYGTALMFSVALFLVFFAIALAGVPLMFALLATTVGMIWANGLSHPLETIFLSFIGGVEPFILIAVPLFIFAGEIAVARRRGQAHRRRSRAHCSASCPAVSAWSPSRRA